MGLKVGEIRRLSANFAFTVRLHERAQPLEVLCDTEQVARIRIRALRASERALRSALRSPQKSESRVAEPRL